MINLGTSTMQDFALGDNLVERIDLGDTTIFDPYTTLTGTLPLTFNARVAGALKNYRVYGDSDGSGVQTENLLNATIEQGSFNPNTGYPEDATYRVRTTFDNAIPAGTYTIAASGVARYVVIYAYTSNDVDTYLRNASTTSWQTLPYTFTTSQTLYLRFAFSSGKIITPSEVYNIMLVSGSTAPTSYIPPGYKIPISLTDGTSTSNYDLFIGSTKLGAEEYVDYAEQKIYKMSGSTLVPTDPPAPLPPIPTYKGENTLSSTETVGEVSVKGRISEVESYRQVEYLKATGTQVIATDIMPKNDYKYETKIKISNSTTGVSNACRMPFGVYETNSNVATGTACLTISNPYSDRNVYYRLGTDSSTSYHFGSTLDNTAVEYTLARPNCKFNTTDIAVSYPINLSEPTVPLAVFGVNRKADNNVELWPYNFTSDCIIYYFKIYDSNGNLIYDLIPVERVSDGELGLYDNVMKKFYNNRGTGTFIKGNYVN